MRKIVLLAVMVIAAWIMVGCAAGSPTPAAPTLETVSSSAATATPEAVSSSPTQAAPESDSSSTSPMTFALVPEETQARFVINEVLNGAPKTVIGATNAVSGELVADFGNPANTQVGTIRVDVSTLATDSGMRNRAIRDVILQTGANPYAEFTPTALSGLPASITIGQPFTFQMTGTLMIKGASKEVTFDVTAVPVSETRIEGLATLANVNYADWGVSILRLPPQVASVEETVTLELEFTAEAQS